MPYIKVKVSQDLYQELGLSPNMELVRSDSKGSIKFVPLSNKSIFDDYESPLLTSPIFGNRSKNENVTSKTFSTDLVSSIGVLPSASVNEVCAAKRFKSSHQESMNSACSILFKEDDSVKYPTDQLCNDTCQDILSEGRNKMKEIVFEDHIDLNLSLLPEGEAVYMGHLNQNPVQEVIASVDSSPVEISSNSNVIKNKVVKYPRECENCSSVFKTNVCFSKHKKHCEKIKENKQFGCPKSFWLKEEEPRICEKCGLIFNSKSSFNFHLKKTCDRFRKINTTSTNSKIIFPPITDSMDSDSVSSDVKFYTPLKKDVDATRFFIRKNVPTEPDK